MDTLFVLEMLCGVIVEIWTEAVTEASPAYSQCKTTSLHTKPNVFDYYRRTTPYS